MTDNSFRTVNTADYVPSAPISPETAFIRFNGGLELENGSVLPEITLAYRTWGQLDHTARNAVFVCHALTGSADADDWWSGIFGPGRIADPANDFIVCSNLIGGCYGSTGPLSPNPATGLPWGPDFPAITVRDMAAAQIMLGKALGIKEFRLVIGGSLGGMIALEWAAIAGDAIRTVVSIAACAAHPAWCIALSEAQRAAIESDPAFMNGRYHPRHQPRAGLSAARMMAMCTYRSAENFNSRFGRKPQPGENRFAVESYLRYQGDKLVDRFDANTYMTLTRAMDAHDLGRGRGGLDAAMNAINVPVLAVSYDSDLLYPTPDQQAIADSIPESRLEVLHTTFGHDAFLIETDELAACVRRFVARTK